MLLDAAGAPYKTSPHHNNRNLQGVGFRPFVFRLARTNRLTGWVQNGSEGVLIEVRGGQAQLHEFLSLLESEAPPLSLKSWLSGARFYTQRKVKSRTFTFPAFCPDFPVVAADDSLHHCQADAVSLENVGAMKSLEGDEESIRKSHVETSAIIMNKIGANTFTFRHTEFYDRIFLLAGIFPCISEKIF